MFLFNLFLLALFMTACTSPTPVPSPTPLPEKLAPVPDIPPTLTPVPSPTEKPSSTPAPTTMANLYRLASVHMLDVATGWAINLDGNVLRTTNGLSAWQDVTPLQAPLPLPDSSPRRPTAFFLDENHAWLAYFSQEINPILLWTTDGGLNWQVSEELPTAGAADYFSPTSLYFLDAQNGWLWAQVYPGMNHVYPAVFRTSDGGKTWKFIYNPLPSSDRLPDDTLRGSYSLSYGSHLFHFSSLKDGVAGTGSLFTTQDGGIKWNPLDIPGLSSLKGFTQSYTYVSAPVFASALDGAIVLTTYEFDHVMLPPGDIFDSLPGAISIIWTHDGGKTWTTEAAPARLGTLTLLNGQEAWFLGTDDISSGAAVTHFFYTSDGGKTWAQLANNSPLPLGSEIQFVDSVTGYAFPPEWGQRNFFSASDPRTQQDYFLQTTDGGRTWK